MLRILVISLVSVFSCSAFAAGLGFNPFEKPSPTSPTSASTPSKPGPSAPSGPAQRIAPSPAPAAPQKSDALTPAKSQNQQPKK